MTVPLLPIIISGLWGASELGLTLTKRAKVNATSKDRHSLAVIWIVYPLLALIRFNVKSVTSFLRLALLASEATPAGLMLWHKEAVGNSPPTFLDCSLRKKL